MVDRLGAPPITSKSWRTRSGLSQFALGSGFVCARGWTAGSRGRWPAENAGNSLSVICEKYRRLHHPSAEPITSKSQLAPFKAPLCQLRSTLARTLEIEGDWLRVGLTCLPYFLQSRRSELPAPSAGHLTPDIAVPSVVAECKGPAQPREPTPTWCELKVTGSGLG